MRWTERQRAMLREMGIALWAPAEDPTRDSVESSPRVDDAHRAEATASGADAAVVGAREVHAREREPASPPDSERGARADAQARTIAPRDADAPDRADAQARTDAPARTGAPAYNDRPVHADAPARPPVSAGADRAARTLPGLAPADWLVIAEPLDAGDPQQEQLLENMLRAIGVGLLAPTRERRAVFMPLPLASGAAATADARSTSSDSAVAAAIEAVGPRCILALGRAAATTLVGGHAPIGGLRGRVHNHGGVPVVVTFALPFLLRHPAEKAKAWSDLCLGVATVAGAADSS